MDFESLHFTRRESRAVCRYSRKSRITYRSHDPLQRMLLSKGFLSGPPHQFFGVHDRAQYDYLVPTDAARRYADWFKSSRREHRMMTRRYWITTAIAIFALIVAIVSLLQSVGLIHLRQYLAP